MRRLAMLYRRLRPPLVAQRRKLQIPRDVAVIAANELAPHLIRPETTLLFVQRHACACHVLQYQPFLSQFDDLGKRAAWNALRTPRAPMHKLLDFAVSRVRTDDD